MSDTALLPVYIRGIQMHFIITEELAALMPMKGITIGKVIFVTVLN